MIKKILIFLLVIVLIASSNGAQWFLQKKKLEATVDDFNMQIAGLQSEIESFGEFVQSYTVIQQVSPGDAVTSNLITPVEVSRKSLAGKDPITLEDMDNTFFRVAVSPGTTLTTDLLMREYSDNTTRPLTVYLDYGSVGLKEGDYIDINITFPQGQDFVALSHLKIKSIDGNAITFDGNILEKYAIRGLYVDYFLTKEYGTVIYADRYINPGIQSPAIIDYILPSYIVDMMAQDPNVIANGIIPPSPTGDRSIINTILAAVDPEAYQKLADGNREFANNVVAAAEAYRAKLEAERVAKEAEEGTMNYEEYDLSESGSDSY